MTFWSWKFALTRMAGKDPEPVTQGESYFRTLNLNCLFVSRGNIILPIFPNTKVPDAKFPCYRYLLDKLDASNDDPKRYTAMKFV